MNAKTLSAFLCATLIGVAVADTATAEKAEDQGPAIAAEAMAKAADLQTVSGGEFVPAEDQVQANLEKLGLHEGYDPKRKSIIAKGTAYYTCKDPAADKGFMSNRLKKARQAYLLAKAEIIRSLLTEFSAMDKASMLAEEGDDNSVSAFSGKMAAFNEKRKALCAKLTEFAKTSDDLDEGEVAAFAEASVDDDFAAKLEAMMTKLNLNGVGHQNDPKQKVYNLKGSADVDLKGGGEKDYKGGKGKGELTFKVDEQDTPEAAAAKGMSKSVLDELKTGFADLKDQYAGLKAESAKIAETPSTELESTTTMISKMPLLGASILTQTESWDEKDGTYSISMAVVWSRKMQEAAKRILVGDFEPAEKKGKFSVHEWIKLQDLSRMIGSRRITDKDGKTLFIGINAGRADIKASRLTAAKRDVDVGAYRDVAFALFGDVAAYTEAKSHLKEFDSGEDAETKYSRGEKLSDVTSQKIEKLNISGNNRLNSEMTVSPITGKKIYVSVYYLEPELAKDAMEIVKKMYADAVGVTKASQYRAGVHEGQEQALKEQRESKEAFNKGVKEGKAAVNEAVRQDEAARAAKRINLQTGAKGSSQTASGKAAGGTYTGDSNVDTNF